MGSPLQPEPNAADGRGRVLLAEGHDLVARHVKRILERQGWTVSGPAHTMAEVATLLEGPCPDAAVLDVHLRDGCPAGVAEALRERGCPVVFMADRHATATLPETLRQVPIVTKPVAPGELAVALRDCRISVASRA